MKNLLKAVTAVVNEAAKGTRIAVVVSAMGKTTDHLMTTAKNTSNGKLQKHELDDILSMGERTSVRIFCRRTTQQRRRITLLRPTRRRLADNNRRSLPKRQPAPSGMQNPHPRKRHPNRRKRHNPRNRRLRRQNPRRQNHHAWSWRKRHHRIHPSRSTRRRRNRPSHRR